MFKVFPTGKAFDILKIKTLWIIKVENGKCWVECELEPDNGEEFTLATFDTEDAAKKYLAQLVDEINAARGGFGRGMALVSKP